jgi:superfamily II DNA helicase RecQ
MVYFLDQDRILDQLNTLVNLVGTPNPTILPVREQIETLQEKPVQPKLSTKNKILDALKEFYKDGNATFRSGYQQTATETALARSNDLFARIPTGFGKSLIYQLPAFMEKSKGLTTVVFFPLVALVEDQVTNINRLWPSMASRMNEKLTSGQLPAPSLLYLHYNEYSLNSQASAYIEMLMNTKKIARIVFDEAQTIIFWNEFTSFRQYLPLIRTQPVPLIFLSGSASPAIVEECMDIFSLPKPQVIFNAAPRKNITYIITQDLRSGIKKMEKKERAIVFVQRTAQTEEVRNNLVQYGKLDPGSIFTYYGRMEANEKSDAQNKWTCTERAVMVCTTAFSLGIDYPHVRYVHVTGKPDSLDSLIQMFGRAGRDGEPSECYYHVQNHYLHTRNTAEARLLKDLEEDLQCVR